MTNQSTQSDDEHLGAATPFARYYDTSPFVRAYIDCALFCGVERAESDQLVGIDKEYDVPVEELAPDTLTRLIDDAEAFERRAGHLIAAAHLTGGVRVAPGSSTSEQAGHDFWLTRNGHGSGFWEPGDWPDRIGKILTRYAKAWGECDLLRGDDGRVHHL